jgi:hypothetical protein
MCAGRLVCDGAYSLFECTYTNMRPALHLNGKIGWRCDGKNLTADVTIGSTTRPWTLSPDSRPRP